MAIKDRIPESRVYMRVEPCEWECKECCATGCRIEPEKRRQEGGKTPIDT
jgi:hypothetical protein